MTRSHLLSTRPVPSACKTGTSARWGVHVGALLIVAGAVVSCGRIEAPRNSPRRSELNVILITIDTLRADYVGAYGGRTRTPSLDRLAADGVVFERCVSQTPLTLPSHTTILSGTYPLHHGVRDNGGFLVPDELELIAGSAAALRRLGEALGLGIVVVTNQAHVGRGLLPAATLDRIHDRLEAMLAAEGASVDAIFHCPHRPEDGCGCRKPAPGMALEAASRFGFDGDAVAAVNGEFTLRDVSQGLELRALRFGCHTHPQLQREVCGGDFEGELKRGDFGASFGMPFVANRVRLVVQVEGIRQ